MDLLLSAVLPAAPALGRNEHRAVARRPEASAFQLPVHGRTSVVHVPSGQPLPHNTGRFALAREGQRQRGADLSGHIRSQHLHSVDTPFPLSGDMGRMFLERLHNALVLFRLSGLSGYGALHPRPSGLEPPPSRHHRCPLFPSRLGFHRMGVLARRHPGHTYRDPETGMGLGVLHA